VKALVPEKEIDFEKLELPSNFPDGENTGVQTLRTHVEH
jgi:hypothetical protein